MQDVESWVCNTTVGMKAGKIGFVKYSGVCWSCRDKRNAPNRVKNVLMRFMLFFVV